MAENGSPEGALLPTYTSSLSSYAAEDAEIADDDDDDCIHPLPPERCLPPRAPRGPRSSARTGRVSADPYQALVESSQSQPGSERRAVLATQSMPRRTPTTEGMGILPKSLSTAYMRSGTAGPSGLQGGSDGGAAPWDGAANSAPVAHHLAGARATACSLQR